MKTFPRRSAPSLPRSPRTRAVLAAVLVAPLAATAAAAGAGDAPEAPRTALERALATVDPARIRADLEFIASDEMRGRDTPSPEQRIAARYLRSRLARLGIAPGGPEGSYFYEYQLDFRALDGNRSIAEVVSERGERALTLGRDYFPAGDRGVADYEFDLPIVWGGARTAAALEEVDARGKWLLVEDNGAAVGRRTLAARRTGARGLIEMPSADYEGKPYAERYGPVVAGMLQGRLIPPNLPANPEPFPHIAVPREVGLTLLAMSPHAPADAGGGWQPEPGTDLGVRFVERRRAAGDGKVTLENVCGFLPGNDPERAKEVVILSAHYDHVGVRGEEIFNGADDNGSGTVGLLALADALVAHGPLGRSVMLMWVSGEERGLLGSRAWVEAPHLPEGHRAVANINLDMIGRNEPDRLLFTPTKARGKDYGVLSRTLEELAPTEGFTRLESADAYWDRSDQAAFAQLGIPVVFLFTDVHADYHKPTDTPDRIDYEKLSRVVRVALKLLDRVQGVPLRPE